MSYTKEGLTSSWQESIELLKPRSIGLLLLVSLRTLLNAYRALLSAWFLPIAYLIGLIIFIYIERLLLAHPFPMNARELTQAIMLTLRWGSAFIYFLLCALYVAMVVRAARPSLSYKNGHYWSKSEIAQWILIPTVLVLVGILPYLLSFEAVPSWLRMGASFFFLKGLLLSVHDWLPGSVSMRLVITFFSPFIILWLLFMFDARKSVGQYLLSFGRAVLMLFYNYPFFFVIYEILRIILSLGYALSRSAVQSHSWLSILGWAILFLLIVPYYICLLANVYTKRLHEQFAVYYRR